MTDADTFICARRLRANTYNYIALNGSNKLAEQRIKKYNCGFYNEEINAAKSG
jgi:hypothetical protein